MAKPPVTADYPGVWAECNFKFADAGDASSAKRTATREGEGMVRNDKGMATV